MARVRRAPRARAGRRRRFAQPDGGSRMQPSPPTSPSSPRRRPLTPAQTPGRRSTGPRPPLDEVTGHRRNDAFGLRKGVLKRLVPAACWSSPRRGSPNSRTDVRGSRRQNFRQPGAATAIPRAGDGGLTDRPERVTALVGQVWWPRVRPKPPLLASVAQAAGQAVADRPSAASG